MLGFYKIVLVGDGEVGKTTFTRLFLLDAFERKYVATLGVEVHPIKFQTNHGEIVFNVWDTAGQERYGGLKDGYYIGADGYMCFYDATNPRLQNAAKWCRNVRRVCEDIPGVVVENKIDLVEMRDTEPPEGVISISTKERKNIRAPFEALARQLTGRNDLAFV